jgi:hypothetical protein
MDTQAASQGIPGGMLLQNGSEKSKNGISKKFSFLELPVNPCTVGDP